MSIAPEVLREAIRRAGSQSKLAKMIGVPQQYVSYWLKKGVPKWREYQIREAAQPKRRNGGQK